MAQVAAGDRFIIISRRSVVGVRSAGAGYLVFRSHRRVVHDGAMTLETAQLSLAGTGEGRGGRASRERFR
ncbi:conserved hypothetical protein [Frankia sp. Hr75.2]|nr:conserved hypothetical protein [Frankia sp. Hr75.2]